MSKRKTKQKKRRLEKRQARQNDRSPQILKQRFLTRLREERSRRRQLTSGDVVHLEEGMT